MKKVALISDGWKRLIVYAWVEGIRTYIREQDEDICLYQFNCHGNWNTDEFYNKGEYNIYRLPDLSGYDGIILNCTNIRDKKMLGETIELLKKSGVPVVSIACDIEGFYYAGIDNEKAINELMEHMYEAHGCRSFIYAGGPEENFENARRVCAYTAALESYGLKLEDNPVWYGDYDFDTGVRYFDEYLRKQSEGGKEPKFPDVFVCANDNIATGLCHCAQERGYRIPEDFRVTGFDNLDKAMFFEPQITTVSQKREQIGEKCMKILSGIWHGEKVNRSNLVDSECIFTESCGCPNAGILDYRSYIKNQIIDSVDKLRHDEEQIRLESSMTACNSYEELFSTISDYYMGLDCEGFAIIVDRRLYESADESVFPVEGYDREQLIVAHLEDKIGAGAVESIDDFKRLLTQNGSGSSYLFTPIHFRERTIGFSVLINANFLYDNPFFYDIHNSLVRTMENLYKKKRLEGMNAQLKQVYNRDQLTGLYNRLAYSEMIEPQFKHYCEENRQCAVAFSDADSFKEINDTYGHERGDEIIKIIARVLSEECPKEGYVYRFGGDEFIAFFPCSTPESAERFRESSIRRLAGEGVHISMGLALTVPSEKRNFEYYLKEADRNMYSVKNKKKRSIYD